MIARLGSIRKQTRRAAIAGLLFLAACGPLPIVSGGAGGPRIDPSQPVTVALLVPKSDGSAAGVARGIENAARLAANSLDGATLDLRVYDTAGTPTGASAAATRALDDGAQIILGPLYSQSISAVSPVVANRNVNVLAFSNNPAVAGGNVFVLGQTFQDVARRLTRFARAEGRRSVAIVHAQDVAGTAGRDAIAAAARSAGLRVATVQGYPLSQRGIQDAGPRIGQAVTASGADTVFLTANVDSDLPLIAETLPANGVSPSQVRYLGLTRWNALPRALTLAGLQGGLFTLPDRGATAAFERRYAAAYGNQPHPLAGLGFDAVQAVGSLIAQGRRDALSAGALTQRAGFRGAYGAFRLRPDGTNDRALAVAQVQNNQVVILDPAPQGFGAAGF
ncbi:penicillin-binding protein activator [Palleronia rufa]|uniref:penicillin-binding protein activator n=1 Tax=Palleronia rufa TaxID=1530186 RepID=UPI00056BE42C|nr:penicillin-binding protein activator [Palleronia rufa]